MGRKSNFQSKANTRHRTEAVRQRLVQVAQRDFFVGLHQARLDLWLLLHQHQCSRLGARSTSFQKAFVSFFHLV